jgi:mono/diheme cytochrome c family protein/glucose/arabinose dehydrogenase
MGVKLLPLWIVLVAVAAWAATRHPHAAHVHAAVQVAEAESPVLAPAQALAAFDIEPGFAIDLFASEPMIEDPVAMAFDEDGRLWVVEMRSYMPNIEGRGELEPTSRVVVLEDTDADGRADTATPFLEGLVLPRAILPCFGGLLVIEPPNLLFCRDTDGDGRADTRETILTGFNGIESPEHAGNALRYGLDNWIHLSQYHIAFRFDGERAVTRPVPTYGQWGMTMDDAGNLYYTPNSDTLRGDYVPSHYAPRNPNQNGIRGLNQGVGRDRETWPAHPTTGINRGYRDEMLRDDGTLTSVTAACGPALYTSRVWPDEFYHNGFICGAAGNLVKRIVPHTADGLPFWTNAYTGDEFLTSTDERFRPVDAAVGPDGALYICDMYRGIIQHRVFLTEYLAGEIRKRGLDKPVGLGRVNREPRRGAHDGSAPPHLSDATDDELVGLLSHPDQWWRLTAQRLLVERQATSAADRVRSVLRESEDPLARLHALWTLEGLGEDTTDDCVAAMADDDPRVRAAACRVAEPHDPRAVFEPMAAVARGDNRTARVQATLSLGELRTSEARDALADIARDYAEDPLVRSAVVSGLPDAELDAIRRLLTDPAWPGDGAGRAIFAELIDAALRSHRSDALLALAVAQSREFPARAEIIFARLAAAQRLGSNNPRRVTVAAEPRGWAELVADGTGALADRARGSDRYLAWPGRRTEGPSLTTDERVLIARGQSLFTYCAGCHGPDGMGSGQYPPLAGSPRVLGPPEDLARVIIHGFEGPLERNGVSYDETMPPAPFTDDRDLAAIMSYVRGAWENDTGPVTPDLVARVRAEHAGRSRPWRAADFGE